MASGTITILCNGKQKEVPAETTVARLVEELDLGGARYAVEMNGEVVHHEDQAETVLKEDDEVNIVTFVGGG